MIRTSSNHRGFTLLEMMLTVTIIVVAAALILPQLSDDERLRLLAASEVITSDLEMAQVMTISYPDEPVVVRFDPGNDAYWLAYATTPDTPITRSDTGAPYLVTLGQGRAVSATGVSISVGDMTADTLVFDAQGGVDDFTTQPYVEIRLGARWLRLDVAPTTGTITESEGVS